MGCHDSKAKQPSTNADAAPVAAQQSPPTPPPPQQTQIQKDRQQINSAAPLDEFLSIASPTAHPHRAEVTPLCRPNPLAMALHRVYTEKAAEALEELQLNSNMETEEEHRHALQVQREALMDGSVSCKPHHHCRLPSRGSSSDSAKGDSEAASGVHSTEPAANPSAISGPEATVIQVNRTAEEARETSLTSFDAVAAVELFYRYVTHDGSAPLSRGANNNGNFAGRAATLSEPSAMRCRLKYRLTGTTYSATVMLQHAEERWKREQTGGHSGLPFSNAPSSSPLSGSGVGAGVANGGAAENEKALITTAACSSHDGSESPLVKTGKATLLLDGVFENSVQSSAEHTIPWKAEFTFFFYTRLQVAEPVCLLHTA